MESYDTGCEAQGILPPRLLLAECTSDLCQSFNVCTEGDLGGLRQGVMTPHKLHNSLKTHTSFPLNNPYNVFAKVRGTGFSTYIPVCYGSPSLLRYKDTSLVRTPFLSLTTTLKVCILIPQLSKKLTVFHPVGLYIRGVPFVITVIMINSVIPSYYTHLSILTFILRSHTHTHLY